MSRNNEEKSLTSFILEDLSRQPTSTLDIKELRDSVKMKFVEKQNAEQENTCGDAQQSVTVGRRLGLLSVIKRSNENVSTIQFSCEETICQSRGDDYKPPIKTARKTFGLLEAIKLNNQTHIAKVSQSLPDTLTAISPRDYPRAKPTKGVRPYLTKQKSMYLYPNHAKGIAKRKANKRKASKRKAPKRKTPKRKIPKRKTPKRKVPKRKAPKRRARRSKAPRPNINRHRKNQRARALLANAAPKIKLDTNKIPSSFTISDTMVTSVFGSMVAMRSKSEDIGMNCNEVVVQLPASNRTRQGQSKSKKIEIDCKEVVLQPPAPKRTHQERSQSKKIEINCKEVVVQPPTMKRTRQGRNKSRNLEIDIKEVTVKQPAPKRTRPGRSKSKNMEIDFKAVAIKQTAPKRTRHGRSKNMNIDDKEAGDHSPASKRIRRDSLGLPTTEIIISNSNPVEDKTNVRISIVDLTNSEQGLRPSKIKILEKPKSERNFATPVPVLVEYKCPGRVNKKSLSLLHLQRKRTVITTDSKLPNISKKPLTRINRRSNSNGIPRPPKKRIIKRTRKP